MKKVSYLTIALMNLVLIGCEKDDHLNNYQPYRPIMSMNIVKITNPEFLDYVLCEEQSIFPEQAEGNFDEHYKVYGIRSIGLCAQELYLGESPYIELTDGYFLIDWKWGNFLYPWCKLMNVQWEEVIDRQQIWDLQTELVSSSFSEIFDVAGFTNREVIDEYLNIVPAPDNRYGEGISDDHLNPFFYPINSLEQIKDSVARTEYLEEVQRQDSLQNVYIERIKQTIQQNALEEVVYFYVSH